jgi:hypothetical protein
VLAPWVIFASAYYGSPFPHTLQAKFHAAGRLEYAWFLASTPAEALPRIRGAPWLAVLLAAPLVVAGLVRLWRWDRRLSATPCACRPRG